MYEKMAQPKLSRSAFLVRLARHVCVAVGMVLVALGIGIGGYRTFVPDLAVVDATLNAAMLLGGMGPVGEVGKWPDKAKWFASAYALFCGLIFIVIAGVILAPILHRVLHHFHLDLDDDED